MLCRLICRQLVYGYVHRVDVESSKETVLRSFTLSETCDWPRHLVVSPVFFLAVKYFKVPPTLLSSPA